MARMLAAALGAGLAALVGILVGASTPWPRFTRSSRFAGRRMMVACSGRWPRASASPARSCCSSPPTCVCRVERARRGAGDLRRRPADAVRAGRMAQRATGRNASPWPRCWNSWRRRRARRATRVRRRRRRKPQSDVVKPCMANTRARHRRWGVRGAGGNLRTRAGGTGHPRRHRPAHRGRRLRERLRAVATASAEVFDALADGMRRAQAVQTRPCSRPTPAPCPAFAAAIRPDLPARDRRLARIARARAEDLGGQLPQVLSAQQRWPAAAAKSRRAAPKAHRPRRCGWPIRATSCAPTSSSRRVALRHRCAAPPSSRCRSWSNALAMPHGVWLPMTAASC